MFNMYYFAMTQIIQQHRFSKTLIGIYYFLDDECLKNRLVFHITQISNHLQTRRFLNVEKLIKIKLLTNILNPMYIVYTVDIFSIH